MTESYDAAVMEYTAAEEKIAEEARILYVAMTRAKEKAKMLWIGTRWSTNDPIGKRLEMLQTLPEYADRKYEGKELPEWRTK